MRIVRYFIQNPLIKWMVLGILFLTTFFAINNIKRFAFPRIDLKEMTITTVVPGFSVEEIDTKVTRKINHKLKSIDGIKKFNSSSYANYSSVFIKIEPDANVEKVKEKIRNEVNNINDFPAEMENRPRFTEIKIDNKPTMIVGITAKQTNVNSIDPYNHLELIDESERFRELIRNSDLVSLVRDDIPKRQIHILLNKEKMQFYEATFEEIQQSINNNEIRLSAGNIEINNRVKSIITDSEKKTPSEISNIILRTRGYQLPDAPLVRLGDIGKIEYGVEKKNSLFHINGDYGFRMEIVKKNQADIIHFSEIISKLINEFNNKSEIAQVHIHENDAWETDLRLSITLNNGFTSLLLIAATLFLFLKLPIAFWAIFEMPATILLSFILIWLSDVTINNISLCGIILTLGMIVDNPTVIGELTMYYQDKGYSQEEASIMGLKKIFKPLIFSVLTTVGSFASMFFIPGILGDFAIEIPLTVMFMLTASLIESTLFLPSHLAHTKMTKRKPIGDGIILFLKKLYLLSIRQILQRPVWFLFFIVVITIGVTYWSLQNVTFYLFSPEQSSKVVITGKTPEDSSLSYTEMEVTKIEALIDDLPTNTVFSTITKIGDSSLNAFTIELIFTPFFERELTATDLQKMLAKRITASSIDLITIDYVIDNGGPPAGKPFEVNVFHPDIEVRKSVMDRITADLQEQGVFTEINTDYEKGIPQERVTPNKEFYFSGIGLNRIAQVLRFAFEGIKVKTTEINDESIDWILKLDDKFNDAEFPLKNLFIASPTGKLTGLERLVNISPMTNVARIVSEQGKVKNVITANFDAQKVSSQKLFTDFNAKYQAVAKEIDDLEIIFSGEAKESFDTFQQFIIAIFGSILFIYMLLVIQFKSFIQPFLVISSIPFGIAGIIFAFNLQNTNISFLTMIGILGFGGVVINSSIIMIDFINSLKKDYNYTYKKEKNKIQTDNIGLNGVNNSNNNKNQEKLPQNILINISISDIIIEGALTRFRPIFITTSSTIIGFFPLAYAVLGQTDSTISPMSTGMVWGMLFGTSAALFIVPAMYLVNEKLHGSLVKLWLQIKRKH